MIKPFPLVCSESLKLASCYNGQFSGTSDASEKIRVGLSITIPGAKHPEGVACGLSHAARGQTLLSPCSPFQRKTLLLHQPSQHCAFVL